MDTMTTIVAGILAFFGGVFIIGLIFGWRNWKMADAIEARIRNQPHFNPADAYVSSESLTGIAIDRHRREVMLADRRKLRRFEISSIVGCEVLQDDVQLAYTNRSSQLAGIAIGGALLGGVGAVVGGLSASKRNINNVQKIVLRILTDDFDSPIHDIVLLDWSFSNKGLSRDSALLKNALEIAERWHARVTALMKADQKLQAESDEGRHSEVTVTADTPSTDVDPQISASRSLRGAIAAGDGSYRFDVVGESHYQAELEGIVGGRGEDGVEHNCVAFLVPEPSNPYDQNAIYISIERQKVGYVPRNQAAQFTAHLSSNGYAIAACRALVIGGWDRGKDDRGHFGVKLDIALPLKLQPVEAPAAITSDLQVCKPQPKETRGLLNFFIVGAVVAVVLLALWIAAPNWSEKLEALLSPSSGTTQTPKSQARRTSSVDVPIPRNRPTVGLR